MSSFPKMTLSDPTKVCKNIFWRRFEAVFFSQNKRFFPLGMHFMESYTSPFTAFGEFRAPIPPLDLSEVTLGGILHWACTCTALPRAAIARLLAAVCEVYAGSSVGKQPFMLLCSPCFTDGPPAVLSKVYAS